MKKSFYEAVFLIVFCFTFTSSSEASEDETYARLHTPFLLPQTSFVVGNANYKVEISNPVARSTSKLDSGGINTYGFDIEVNHSRYLNIGGYFRIESQSLDKPRIVNSQFTTLFGGFLRCFYAPSFLIFSDFKTSLFARVELGGGPTFHGGPNGMIAQTGIYYGFETYINKWVGLGLSYGNVLEYGKVTLSALPAYKNATIKNTGSVFLVSIKTTFF